MPYLMAIKDIAKKYVLQMENGRFLSNRGVIEIMDARIMQLMERLDHEERPERMANLLMYWQEYKNAARVDNGVEMLKYKQMIDTEFEMVYQDYAAWSQMLEVFDVRRKALDSEVKIAKELKAVLTAEQTKNLVAKLLAVILREVKDPKILKRINYSFSRIIGEERVDQDDDILDIESVDDYE